MVKTDGVLNSSTLAQDYVWHDRGTQSLVERGVESDGYERGPDQALESAVRRSHGEVLQEMCSDALPTPGRIDRQLVHDDSILVGGGADQANELTIHLRHHRHVPSQVLMELADVQSSQVNAYRGELTARGALNPQHGGQIVGSRLSDACAANCAQSHPVTFSAHGESGLGGWSDHPG